MSRFLLSFDRSFADCISRQLYWLIGLTFFCLFCILGLTYYYTDVEQLGLIDRLTQLLRLFIDTGGVWKSSDELKRLNWPDGLIICTSMLGVVLFCGALVSVITNMLSRREAHYLSGETIYNLKQHYIILGYNEMAPSLIGQLFKKGAKDILLFTARNVADVRFELKALLSKKQFDTLIFKHGRRDNNDDLQLLGIDKAVELYILGDNNENDHDSLNIRSLNLIANIISERKTLLPCNVIMEHQTTFSAFQTANIDGAWKEKFSFRPINVYEEWAKSIFLGNDKYYNENTTNVSLSAEISRIYADMNPSSKKHVHVVVFGMSRMGWAMGVETAHMCHFPNFNGSLETKTTVTFIDENAETEMNYFRGKYRHIFEIEGSSFMDGISGEKTDFPPTYFSEKDCNFLDTRFEFIKGSAEMPIVQETIRKWIKDENDITILAICYDDPARSLASALYLPDETYTSDTLILVYQQGTNDLINAISNSEKYKRIFSFGMTDKWLDIKQLSLENGKRINGLYCGTNDIDGEWEKIPTAHQWSSLYSADSIKVKVESIGLTAERPNKEQRDLLNMIEHNRWNMEKLLLGFRKPKEGEITDKKHFFIHEDIRPFDELTEEKKNIDERITRDIYRMYIQNN